MIMAPLQMQGCGLASVVGSSMLLRYVCSIHLEPLEYGEPKNPLIPALEADAALDLNYDRNAVQKHFLNGDDGFDGKDATEGLLIAHFSSSSFQKFRTVVVSPFQHKFKYLFALATDMGVWDILRFAKYKFLSYDKYAQGTVVWKLGSHLSMCGWVLSFPAYVFGVQSGGQKAEKKIQKLDSVVKPLLQEFSGRMGKVESAMDTETRKRGKLSKKTAAKFKQLNKRVSVLEIENLAKVNNDKKAAAFSVRVTGDFLDQIARDNRAE